jgi:hypothetical protein
MLKDEDLEGGFIGWRSIPKFKGRESHAVIITDVNLDKKYLDNEAAMAEAVNRQLDHLYVGISRANYKVKILCDENMLELLRQLGL